MRPRVRLDACRAESPVEAPNTEGVLAAIDALPQEDRQVILLHFLRGLAEEEVAAHLGLTPWVVRRRLQVAVQRLRGSALDLPPQG